jgi:hypothetical protein
MKPTDALSALPERLALPGRVILRVRACPTVRDTACVDVTRAASLGLSREHPPIGS